MLRSRERQLDFEKRGSTIYYCGGDTPLAQFGIRHNFNTEPLLTGEGQYVESVTPETLTEPVNHIIVTTKAQNTLAAIASYRHAIDAETSMLFLQNGLGVREELDKKLWKKATKPLTYFGMTTHGSHRLPSPFYEYRHAGLGHIEFAAAPGTAEDPTLFTDALQSSSTLGCQDMLPYSDLLLKQCQKLAVNACVNPLTAIMDCNNGQLLDSPAFSNIIQNVVNEASAILKAYCDNVIGGGMNPALIAAALKPQRITEVVNHVIKLTQGNSSSMREDVRNGRPTEINYINRFLVEQASKHRKPSQYNQMLADLIRAQYDLNKV